jgi:signal transduction histidine kinase
MRTLRVFFLGVLLVSVLGDPGKVFSKAAAVGMADSVAFWQKLTHADQVLSSNNDSAMALYQSLSLDAKQMKFIPGLCNANIGLAMCYFVKGEYGIAFEILSDNVRYFNAIPLADQISNYRILMYAGLYTRKYDEGLQYGKKAVALNNNLRLKEEPIKSDARLVSILGGIATIYMELGQLDSARSVLDLYTAKLNPESPYYKIAQAQLYEFEGIYYGKKGAVQKSLSYFQQCAQLNLAIDPHSTYPRHISTMIFDMYVKNKQFAEAQKYIKDIMTSEEIQNLDLRADVFPKMARIDSATGDFKSAYTLLQTALVLKDSIQQQEILSRSTYYNNMIGLQEANEQLLEKTNAVRRTRLIVVSIAIFAIVVFIYLLIYFHNRKLRMIIRHHQELKEISNDLHDEINPILGYARMMLSRVETENESDKALLQKSNTALLETMDNLRLLTRQMNMSSHDSSRYQETLQEMIVKICEAYRFKHTLELAFNDKLLSEIVKRNLFLIIQELVHNSMKHSNGTSVFVQIRTDHDLLKATYADDGMGIDNSSSLSSSVENLLPKIYKRIVAMSGQACFSTLKDYPGMCIVLEIPIKK